MTNFRPVLLLLSASLLPVLILATVMGWLFIFERQGRLDVEIQDRANLVSRALQRELSTQAQLLSVVADSPRMDLPVSRSNFAETARRLTNQIPAWQQIRVSDQDGHVALAFPPLSLAAPKTVIDRESHDRVIRTQENAVGDMVIGPQGRAAFAVRVPVRRGGKLQAVLSTVIQPQFVTQVLTSSGLPSEWSGWVVDGKQNLIATNDHNELAGLASTRFAVIHEDGTAELTGGQRLRVADAAIEGTPWRVQIGIPLDLYGRAVTQATVLLVAASVGALILAGVIGYLLHRELRARAETRESLANWQRMDALGKLTGQAAHDFNNLLMIFQSGVEGIDRRRDDPERITRLLNGMREGVDRGKNITRRLLSFARRSNQGAEHVDLSGKLDEVYPLLKQALNDGIAFTVEIPDTIWGVHVDPSSLEIALVNVLTNAREAIVDGGSVKITARNVEDGEREDERLRGPMVALTVTDTGRGIATADLKRIFEPFYSSKSQGGPGLGLTQVLGFAESNGGTAKAVSLPGRGSSITIFLPKSTCVGGGEDQQDLLLPDALLLVDDTASSLEAARAAIEDVVATIYTATNAVEALQLLQKHPEIKAVLSDIMMPGMSGIELAENLRTDRPDVAIVLMTGFSDKLEAGVQLPWRVVVKPFKRSEIVAALGTAHSGRPDLSNVVRLQRPGGDR